MALSAQLDREDPGVATAAVDAHLAGCAGCRAWLRQVVRVTRAARVQPADEVPDLTGSILARVAVEAPGTRSGEAYRTRSGEAYRTRSGEAYGTRSNRRARLLAAARVALFAVAAGQWATGLAVMFAPGGPGMALHGVHELGAFNLALAVAFGAAAWRPSQARAHLPLLAALVAGLTVLTAADLAVGHVTVVAEAAHLLLVAGLVLTAVLARGYHSPGRPPVGSGAGPTPAGSPGTGGTSGPLAPLPRATRARDAARKVA